MKITKKALLYDIANLAYTIADNGEPGDHCLHRVRDICQDGNIDRVARILGLAYADILSILLPLITTPAINIDRDFSSSPHDYEICFRNDESLKFRLTNERKLKIKETAHEYMVCMVLADWLAITFPEAADVWKFRMDDALNSLQTLVSSIVSSASCTFRRPLSPF